MTRYKPHYACFNCRKTFKRRLLSDLESKDDFQLREAKCPDCGQLMANMGKDFEAPKKSAIKAWEHFKLLYSVGITHHSCGCSGPGYIPNTSEGLLAYFNALINDYQQELTFWRKRAEPTSKRENHIDTNKNWAYISKMPDRLRPKSGTIKNDEAIAYWIERIKQVEEKVRRIGGLDPLKRK